MRIILILLLLLPLFVMAGKYTPLGTNQKDEDLSTAQAPPNIPDGATQMLMCAESSGSGAHWTDDGVTTPTSSVGSELESGECFFYDGGALSNVKIIEDSTDTIIQFKYYKEN